MMIKSKSLFSVAGLLLVMIGLTSFATACKSDKPKPQPGNLITNSIGMKLIYVPAGDFNMGSPPEEKGRQDDELLHKVKITCPFRIGMTEVTQAQWQTVMGNNPANFTGDDLPVEKISWKSAIAFCKKLSETEGKTYRLPTEAEWEYACRAGVTGPVAGTGQIDDMAWYDENSKEQSHTVATKTPNTWGIFEMHGNVSEWCGDYYSSDYPEADVTDPIGPSEGKYRVIRGGSWGYFEPSCRCAARSSAPTSYQLKQTGFRVVMEIEKE
jgi:formylglycine-generating enzyme required for sulfatase activity